MSEYMKAVTYSALCEGCGKTQSILIRREEAVNQSITRQCSSCPHRQVTLHRER